MTWMTSSLEHGPEQSRSNSRSAMWDFIRANKMIAGEQWVLSCTHPISYFSYSSRPEGLTAAERVLRKHLNTLECFVSFEQRALLQYLPTRDRGGEDGEYRRGFRPLNKRFLEDQRIQNFIRRFLCHDGDGIRGCWVDRKLEFVNSVEGWSVLELMDIVKMHKVEWDKEGDDLIAFYRKIPGALL